MELAHGAAEGFVTRAFAFDAVTSIVALAANVEATTFLAAV